MNRKPEWLRIMVMNNGDISQVEGILQRLSLHTVCEEANCPNRMECFSRKTATFMILGRVCTRNCRFCNVEGGIPEPVDDDEPEHAADAVKELGLLHSVITSVTRDDLPDGGSEHFARTIRAIRDKCPGTIVEVLIPDFKGDKAALETVVKAAPDIINHNVETVPRLYRGVRPQACYERSLQVLQNVKSMNDKIYTKSGIMVGLGESRDEVIEVLKTCGMQVVIFSRSDSTWLPRRNITRSRVRSSGRFADYRQIALDVGLLMRRRLPCRSSYNASEALKKV